MKLANRRRTPKLKRCYKIVNNLSCIPLSLSLLTLTPLLELQTQNNSTFLLRGLRLTKQSFFVNVVSLWNALPEAIVSAPSPCVFKHHLYRLYSV